MTFIDYLENLYESINIFRAIIIISDSNYNYNNLINELKDKNHSPIFINNYINKNDINYDYRLFIINDIENLYKIKRDSYNLIIIF